MPVKPDVSDSPRYVSGHRTVERGSTDVGHHLAVLECSSLFFGKIWKGFGFIPQWVKKGFPETNDLLNTHVSVSRPIFLVRIPINLPAAI